jgi:hypothetical protein
LGLFGLGALTPRGFYCILPAEMTGMGSAGNADQVSPKECFQFNEAAVEIALQAAIERPLGLSALASLVRAVRGFVA